MGRQSPLALPLAAALLLAGCAGNGDRQPGAAPASATPGTVTTTSTLKVATTSTARPATTTAASGWSTAPVTVRREVAVPPVPVLAGIRSAAHPGEGFDRITFDFRGSLPGYEARYVSHVVEDASGRPAHVPGHRFLQVTFRPTQAHDDAGHSTVTARHRTVDYPTLEAYAIVGDFEGVVSVALGLDDVVAYRVGELPGRIYVDVAA